MVRFEPAGIAIIVDPFPVDAALAQLWRAAWDGAERLEFQAVLAKSLTHIGAYDGDALVGFVNVAGDGGIHGFLLDTCVDPRYRRQGIATRLVLAARDAAQQRGAQWLHVDFEPHLAAFYAGCAFRPTAAGVMRLG